MGGVFGISESPEGSWITVEGLKLVFVGDVYRPSDDTWLALKLLDSLKPKAGLCVDLGCGSGILGLYGLIKGYCERTVFVDIDEDALATTLRNIPLNNAQARSIVVSSDNAVLHGAADLVLANPPYLPAAEGKVLDAATEGGVHGYEAVLHFINVAHEVLRPGGLLILVYSSLSNQLVVEEHLSRKGFTMVAFTSKNMFYETLYVAGVVKARDTGSASGDRGGSEPGSHSEDMRELRG